MFSAGASGLGAGSPKRWPQAGVPAAPRVVPPPAAAPPLAAPTPALAPSVVVPSPTATPDMPPVVDDEPPVAASSTGFVVIRPPHAHAQNASTNQPNPRQTRRIV